MYQIQYVVVYCCCEIEVLCADKFKNGLIASVHFKHVSLVGNDWYVDIDGRVGCQSFLYFGLHCELGGLI